MATACLKRLATFLSGQFSYLMQLLYICVYIYTHIEVSGSPEWDMSVPPHAVISSLGAMGGGAGGQEKFRVVVAVVARLDLGSARPPFLLFLLCCTRWTLIPVIL